MGADISLQQVRRVEQFYYREARLLDERQFTQWLRLLSREVVYVLPARYVPLARAEDRDTEQFHTLERELSQEGEAHLREEDYQLLSLRAQRALMQQAWAENPPARTRRIIANVEVLPGERPQELQTYSNFLLHYSRHGRDYQDSGQRQDILQLEKKELRIFFRRVILDSTLIAAPTVGLLF